MNAIQTDGALIERLEEALQPKGSAPLVRLHLRPAAYFNQSFVQSCIQQVRVKQIMQEPLNALETLAMHVLMDSAGITEADLVSTAGVPATPSVQELAARL